MPFGGGESREPVEPGEGGTEAGPSTTRVEILDAARTAKVDAALVARAFDGKHGLFLAAVQWPWDSAERIPRVVAGPKGRARYRIAQLLIDTWEDPDQRAPIMALPASTAGSGVARRLLGDFITTHVHVPIARACGFDQPELRGALDGAQAVGLCMARYVLEVEPLASLDAASLIDIAGGAARSRRRA